MISASWGSISRRSTRRVQDQNARVEEAKSAYHAAIQGRLEAQDDLVRRLSSAANLVYAAPEEDPSAVASLGLSTRSTSKARIVPKTPLGFVAVIGQGSRILLRWNRSGNAAEVIFVLESRSNGGSWSHVESTTKTRLVLDGVVPGVATEFRVIATKNGRQATPSATVAVYATEIHGARRAA